MKLPQIVSAVGLLVSLIGCSKSPSNQEATTSDPAATSDAAEMEKLQGVWQAEVFDVGEKRPDIEVKKMRLIVHKDLLHIVEDFKTHRGRSFEFKVDPKQTPKQMDLVPVPKRPNYSVSPSIYKLEGDGKLTIALAMADKGEAPRPTEFKSLRSESSDPPYGVMLMEFVKTKEAIPQEYIDLESKPRIDTPPTTKGKK